MIKTILLIILVQVYWLSFPLIGYSAVCFYRHFFPHHRISAQITALFSQSRLLGFLIVTTVAFFLFGIISTTFYLLGIPAWIFTGLYVAAALASLVHASRKLFSAPFYTLYQRLPSFSTVKKANPSWFLIFSIGLATALLAVDYAYSLYVGGTFRVSRDALLHMTNVNETIANGFSLVDPYFQTILDGRYGFSALHALYVPPTQLLTAVFSDVLSIDVWRWSLAFFRLLQWLAITGFAYTILRFWFDTKRTTQWTAATVIWAVSFLSGLLFTANYPNVFANVWVILYCIGITLYERKITGPELIFISAFLLAVTHPTYALMTAMFTVFYFILRAVFDYKIFIREKKWLVYGLATVLMMLTPIFAATFPNYISTSKSDTTISDFSATLTFPQSPLALAISAQSSRGNYPDSTADVYLRSALLFMGAVIVVYGTFRLRQQKPLLFLMLGLVTFLPLIVYNPLAIEILSHFLYKGIFLRFTAMNVLWYVVLPIFAYVLVRGIIHLRARWKRKESFDVVGEQTIVAIVVSVVIMIPSLLIIYPAYQNYKSHGLAGGDKGNHQEYTRAHAVYRDFSPILNEGVMVVADNIDSYELSSVLNIRSLVITLGHISPNTDGRSRLACQEIVLDNLRASDVKFVGADFVVLNKHTQHGQASLKIAKTRDFLRLVAQNKYFVVFKVETSNVDSNEPAANPCKTYKQVES